MMLRKQTDTWFQLTPQRAHVAYHIPLTTAASECNAFYTNCDANVAIPADVSCNFFGLVACPADPDWVTLYVDTFNHSDLYDMYGVEVIESEEFNYLEAVTGSLSVRKRLAQGMVDILKDRALQMPETISWQHAFLPLSQAELELYRILSYPQLYTQEFYRFRLSREDTGDSESSTVTLVRLVSPRVDPTFLSLGVTRFQADELQSHVRFKAFANGRGTITLSRAALLELAEMLKRRTEHLVEP